MKTAAQLRAAIQGARFSRFEEKALLDLVDSIAGIPYASAGPGLTTGTGTVIKRSIAQKGEFIETKILVDLTGLRSTAANDIIGVDGTALACYLGQYLTAESGTPFAGTVECLEVPAGSTPDIDLYAADEATGVEDGAIGDLTETQLLNAGAHTLGSSKPLTALPANGQYLYLVAGATLDADYTAGKLLITFLGY